jgi:hypothetical protein
MNRAELSVEICTSALLLGIRRRCCRNHTLSISPCPRRFQSSHCEQMIMILELTTAATGKTNRPMQFDDCCGMFMECSECFVDQQIGGESPPNLHRLILRWMFWKKWIQRGWVGSPRRRMVVDMISLAQDSDLLDRIERSIVHSMTWGLRFRRLPSLWSCQILRPKWPCSALCRSCCIDPAERSARLAEFQIH